MGSFGCVPGDLLVALEDEDSIGSGVDPTSSRGNLFVDGVTRFPRIFLRFEGVSAFGWFVVSENGSTASDKKSA